MGFNMKERDDKTYFEYQYRDKSRRCAAWSPWTGFCRKYKEAQKQNTLIEKFCAHWKCRPLNWLSRLLAEPTWDGYIK